MTPKTISNGTARIFKRRKQLLLRVPTFQVRYYFTLIGTNGEPVAQSEAYNAKADALATVAKYFPQFAIEDETGE